MQRLGIIAAESGAALVVTHHINKSGDITSRAAARKAIKGTTGTIDGARNVIVVWQAPEKKGKLAMEAGIVQDEAELFVAAVVKANARGADLREKFFSRDMTQGGAMREVTNMPAEPEQEAPAKRGRGRPRNRADRSLREAARSFRFHCNSAYCRCWQLTLQSTTGSRIGPLHRPKPAENLGFWYGSGGGTRTPDTRIMIPTELERRRVYVD